MMTVNEYINFYKKGLENGNFNEFGLKKIYEEYKKNESDWLKSKDYQTYINGQKALEIVLGIGKYTIETLTEINQRFCNAHYKITDSDLKMANDYVFLIEKTRSKTEPKVGDRIRYTNEYGDYYKLAHIELVRDGIVNICESPYVPFICKDTLKDGILCSTSGGAWDNIPIDKLIYVGTEEKTFCDWGHCHACADGAIEFKAEVSVWEYDCHETPHTTKTHNRMFISYSKEPKYFGYKFIGDGNAWKDELEFQSWLETVHGEVSKGYHNQLIVWYAKQKEVHCSPNEYESLELPEDSFLMNGSKRRCKRSYNEKNNTLTTYFVWYWDDDSMYFYDKWSKQSEIIELYKSDVGYENIIARRKILTGVVKPIDVMGMLKED